jgi:glucokinase
MAAGPGIASYASQLIRQGRGSSLAGHMASGGELTGEMVGEAAEAGDSVALEAVRRAAHYLGIGVLNLIHIFDPEMVILGGGVTKLGPLLFDPVLARVLDHAMTQVQRETPIVPAALGDDAGLLGAVAWAMDQSQAQ